MKTINEFRGKNFFLSNFYLSPVAFEGATYPCVENAFQAAKLLDARRRRGFETLEPGQAKRYGRRVGPSHRLGARQARDHGAGLVFEKFRDFDLAAKLLGTGDASLVEGNRWGDTFWGVDVRSGRGQNHLGRILMGVREQLGNIESLTTSR